MGFREIELLLGDAPERVSNGDTLISKTSSSLMEDVGSSSALSNSKLKDSCLVLTRF